MDGGVSGDISRRMTPSAGLMPGFDGNAIEAEKWVVTFASHSAAA